jgi:hypothetical protein
LAFAAQALLERAELVDAAVEDERAFGVDDGLGAAMDRERDAPVRDGGLTLGPEARVVGATVGDGEGHPLDEGAVRRGAAEVYESGEATQGRILRGAGVGAHDNRSRAPNGRLAV